MVPRVLQCKYVNDEQQAQQQDPSHARYGLKGPIVELGKRALAVRNIELMLENKLSLLEICFPEQAFQIIGTLSGNVIEVECMANGMDYCWQSQTR